VIHADPAFAADNLEAEPTSTAARLMAAFRAATGAPAPDEARLHRWRYARTSRPLGAPCLWSAEIGIGLAGDWCLGPDAGDAVASGRALADAVLAGA
jgi:renalase